VGANIGLTSLNVFSELKGINIYAFEPGPHQYSLFKRTIEENGLNTIHLSSFALSEKEGLADFIVHSSEHASGDGFVDTGRAGKGNTIQVRTITLDSWWEKNRKPSIAAIKIDAEGSEFWILKGAQALIEKERPLILMEFYPPHFANYPFSELDVLHWFAQNGYQVFSVDHNQEITPDNFMNYKDELRDIIARPTDSANTEQSRPLSV
jgi:FkbM family methyltransferase